MDGWGIPKMLGRQQMADESPTSSEFVLFGNIQALGTQLQTAMGLEGEAGKTRKNECTEDFNPPLKRHPSVAKAGVPPATKVAPVARQASAGEQMSSYLMTLVPSSSRSRTGWGAVGIGTPFSETTQGKPVLAKYLAWYEAGTHMQMGVYIDIVLHIYAYFTVQTGHVI